jgi:hypothetical protein
LFLLGLLRNYLLFCAFVKAFWGYFAFLRLVWVFVGFVAHSWFCLSIFCCCVRLNNHNGDDFIFCISLVLSFVLLVFIFCALVVLSFVL